MTDAAKVPARRRRTMDLEAKPEEVAEAAVAAGLTSHEGFVRVNRTCYGQDHSSEDKILVPLFTTAPARVRVLAGATRNLGDHNFAKVELSVELPCYPEDSEIRRTYEYASGLLDELIPVELVKAGVEVPAFQGQAYEAGQMEEQTVQ